MVVMHNHKLLHSPVRRRRGAPAVCQSVRGEAQSLVPPTPARSHNPCRAGGIRCPGSSALRAASGVHSLVRWHGELPTQARGVGVHERSLPRRGGVFAHRCRYAGFTSSDPLRIA